MSAVSLVFGAESGILLLLRWVVHARAVVVLLVDVHRKALPGGY